MKEHIHELHGCLLAYMNKRTHLYTHLHAPIPVHAHAWREIKIK